MKNDFDSQAKALEALKTAEKISRPNPFWAVSHALRGMDVELVLVQLTLIVVTQHSFSTEPLSQIT